VLSEPFIINACLSGFLAFRNLPQYIPILRKTKSNYVFNIVALLAEFLYEMNELH
jgi:hypothetical protein